MNERVSFKFELHRATRLEVETDVHEYIRNCGYDPNDFDYEYNFESLLPLMQKRPYNYVVTVEAVSYGYHSA